MILSAIELQAMPGCTPLDADVLKDAAEQLFDARLVLKYTYVHAYFMKDQDEMQKNRKGIFVERQERLSTYGVF
eukprot:SAG31_NODE_3222_length_4523_cov_2.551085_4_plen_74_part_00